MNAPDVSVVVAVYNTMPYLIQCLDSLVAQTIGLDRLQVVAVDDGSTDGSGAELDRYAARHPGVFTVIHQANSGGPAAPFNRGLDAATGRYVFFVGADDHLGPDALRRLVEAADAWESDVLLGRVVGVNSRHIYQDIFARNQVDVDLFDSPLPRSLANTKLFRRELLENYGIRYREDLPLGSDLPFTLEACYRARRISVLADYDCYYAVRRHRATNITYLSRHADRLRTVEATTAFVAELIPAGRQRDAVLARRFDHEIAKLLEDDLLRLDRETQQLVHDGIGRLVRAHLTEGIAAQLNAETRIRLALTRDGALDDLLAVIRQDAQGGVPPTVVEGSRRYAAYPGFRDPARGLPDACFEVTPDWYAKLDATALAWETDERGEKVLTITAASPVPDLAAVGAEPLAVSAEEIPGEVTTLDRGPRGTTLRIRFRASDLLAGTGPTGQRRAVSAQVGGFDPGRAAGAQTATGAAGSAAVRAPRIRAMAPLVRRRGARLYVVTPVLDESGRLMISVVPVTAARVAAQLRRTLRRIR
ncbi:glycosyltransferase [Micromonospora sp. DR5-3]|uniref:glycosyltransferase family 2 protein n=1 Tax=unclassified Micromonospora TaxID=2617518 RepID=UPI0011DC053A|nr:MULTISPECIES: glycosyltransferase [unclassified Micromonospora]MCW3816594.1 glycosyltransferase [Micromonospora sp. DR5-3]TYC20217.1 glycosyltransferase [Micromonospora sp. MP36]